MGFLAWLLDKLGWVLAWVLETFGIIGRIGVIGVIIGIICISEGIGVVILLVSIGVIVLSKIFDWI